MVDQSTRPELSRLWEVRAGPQNRSGAVTVYSDRKGSAARWEIGRLPPGSLLEELALIDGQLQFKCLSGGGPDFGWVSVQGAGSVSRLDPRGGVSGPGLRGIGGPDGLRLWRAFGGSSSVPCPINGRLYKPTKFAGITFFIAEGCFEAVPGLEEHLHADAMEIARILPEHALEHIRDSVAVWVNEHLEYVDKTDTEDMRSGLISHWGSCWASRKGDLAAKSGCAELLRARDFLRCVQRAPALLLHELSHCCHNLHEGTADSIIAAAFAEAQRSGRYDGLRASWKHLHYTALEDHFEFFAEASEAFFSSARFHNECIPHLHEELEVFDPSAFAMCERVWGIRGADVVSREEFPERWHERLVYGEGAPLDYSGLSTWVNSRAG